MPHLAAALLILAAAGEARRPIRETDLYRFVWVADPQISPDGRQVAFVRVAVDKKKDGYDTAIWMVPADGSSPARPFTGGPQDLSPRWSPDGRRIAFTRALEKDGRTVLLPGRSGALSVHWRLDGASASYAREVQQLRTAYRRRGR